MFKFGQFLEAFDAHGAAVAILWVTGLIGIGVWVMKGDKWLAEIGISNLLLALNIRGKNDKEK